MNMTRMSHEGWLADRKLELRLLPLREFKLLNVPREWAEYIAEAVLYRTSSVIIRSAVVSLWYESLEILQLTCALECDFMMELPVWRALRRFTATRMNEESASKCIESFITHDRFPELEEIAVTFAHAEQQTPTKRQIDTLEPMRAALDRAVIKLPSLTQAVFYTTSQCETYTPTLIQLSSYSRLLRSCTLRDLSELIVLSPLPQLTALAMPLHDRRARRQFHVMADLPKLVKLELHGAVCDRSVPMQAHTEWDATRLVALTDLSVTSVVLTS